MVQTSKSNPGTTSLLNPQKTLNDIIKGIKTTGYSKTAGDRQSENRKADTYEARRASQKKAWQDALSQPAQSGGSSSESSSGSGITTENDAGNDVLSGGSSDGSESSDSSGSSGTISPLLQGNMTFEELVGEICKGLDLIFAVKRSTIVVTDYESIYAEAKYLRDNYHDSVQNEDISLWQLEEGSYELDVAEYGFYNTVKVHYKNGTVTESYEDLVRVYGEVVAEYTEPTIDKSSAIMKAKAYLAAHIRDFDMTVKASLLHDADIDIGDIVTLENPMTMRDDTRVNVEKRDPEYFFVTGNSIKWEGGKPITNDIEMRYGAKSPQKLDVPESGTPGYSNSGSSNIQAAIDEVGQMASAITYSSACQTHDCVKQNQTGDCFGMSDFIACELKSRGVTARIRGYPTSVPEHRSVQYKDSSGQWVNFPYREYGCNQLFNDTSGINNSHDVSSTCGG